MINRNEQDRIKEIADRAMILAADFGVPIERVQVVMSVALAHEKTPLKLDALYMADNFNFIHDVCGIMRHIDYETGQLRDCFLPRYAR